MDFPYSRRILSIRPDVRAIYGCTMEFYYNVVETLKIFEYYTFQRYSL